MPLRANVSTVPPIPWELPNTGGKQGGIWSPTSLTLIHGEKEALLVDTPITIPQTEKLIEWLEKTVPEKRLTTVYITHGHPDHWLGLSTLKKKYSDIRILSTAATLEHMKYDIDTDLVFSEAFPASGRFNIEGHECHAIEVGHSDTRNSTILWVPSLKLAPCGDVVYGDVHQMLGEANTTELRSEWISAIEKVEAFGPEIVIGGHRMSGEVAGVLHLAATKRYIQQFEKLLPTCKSSDELQAKMEELYPDRFNPNVLKWGCNVAFGLPMFEGL
ncbi:putative metallo-beta-lactamase domain protein [Botrytis fragariae]|uniref:Putative metallo-beta-lactamase domain protein n=1 Tax=Botrytis fragariae TaxID=1964551 RepID=A0A8H6ANV4_9HELO|nr:putative metallo-beta-lactamase domain protein [Botrytis fragariae]KAF5871193.1 putative metallo-beta-lactamase domain protein [Botrytis fragariae]